MPALDAYGRPVYAPRRPPPPRPVRGVSATALLNPAIPARYRPRPKPRPKPKPRPRITLPPAKGAPKPKPVVGTVAQPVTIAAPVSLQAALQHQKTAAAAAAIAHPLAAVYVNPFAKSGPVVGGRVDQGVDYTGKPGAPIGALGPGKITIATQGSGWPGGGFIAYLLSAGPAKGHTVYVAEDVAPTVAVGQTVKAGQTIGQFNQGGWIETGWGAPGGDWTMANATGQSGGSVPVGVGAFSTGFGVAFDKLIRRLGGPSGQVYPRVSGGAPPWASATGGGVTGLPAAPAPAPGPSPRPSPALPVGAVSAPPMVPVANVTPVRPPIPSARPAARPGPPPRSVTPGGPFLQPRPGPPTIFGPLGQQQLQPRITPVPTASTPTSRTTRAARGGTLGSVLAGGAEPTGAAGASAPGSPAAGKHDWLIVVAIVGALGWLLWREMKKGRR